MGKRAWHGWYHVMGHTYGTWLPGDPKGFRTRHHREHIEGDYKNPPPRAKYAKRHAYAKRLMKRDPVILSVRQRQRALEEMVISLLRNDIKTAIFAVSRIHFHGLTKCPDYDPRKWVGIAKKESSHYLKRSNLAPLGGLWAIRCKCLPVEGERHFWAARKYIADHAKKGAEVWQHPRLPR